MWFDAGLRRTAARLTMNGGAEGWEVLVWVGCQGWLGCAGLAGLLLGAGRGRWDGGGGEGVRAEK